MRSFAWKLLALTLFSMPVYAVSAKSISHEAIDHFVRAAMRGDRAIVEIYLNAGVSPNARNTKGYTALQIAEAFGQADMVEFLLSKGAKTDTPKSN